ncbi:hypothetical protein LINPERPRIM_LOCUS36709 [Linum perenne]
MAGCSILTQGLNVEWVCAQGIPLHLRSLDLFYQLGDLCGGYVEHDERGCNLNAIRLKVRSGQKRPAVAFLRFQKERFRIRFSYESESSVVSSSAFVLSSPKSKGKAVVESSVTRADVYRKERGWRPVVREVGESSSGGQASQQSEVPTLVTEFMSKEMVSPEKSAEGTSVGLGAPPAPPSVLAVKNFFADKHENRDGSLRIYGATEAIYSKGMGSSGLVSASLRSDRSTLQSKEGVSSVVTDNIGFIRSFADLRLSGDLGLHVSSTFSIVSLPNNKVCCLADLGLNFISFFRPNASGHSQPLEKVLTIQLCLEGLSVDSNLGLSGSNKKVQSLPPPWTTRLSNGDQNEEVIPNVEAQESCSHLSPREVEQNLQS